MDKRIIYTILSILLLLGIAIVIIMVRRFVPYTEEAIFYDFNYSEISEDLSIDELKAQNIKVAMQLADGDINTAIYALYIYDYEILMELYEDLLMIETVLMQINYGRIAGLLITESDSGLILIINALPENKSIYKEYTVNVSKNFLYIIPYTGGMVLQLDFFVQVLSMLRILEDLEQTTDYYQNPVSLEFYTSGSDHNTRIFFTIRGDNYYLRNSFCTYCGTETQYEGLKINNTISYILS